MILKKVLSLFLAAFMAVTFIFAEEPAEEESVEAEKSEDKENEPDFTNIFVPGVDFKMLQFDDSEYIFTPAFSFGFVRTKSEGVDSCAPDLFMIQAECSNAFFTKSIVPEGDKIFESFGISEKLVWGKNSFGFSFGTMGMVDDVDLEYLVAGLSYSRQFVKGEHFSFSAGISIASGSSVKPIGVMPLPVLEFNYKARYFEYTASMGALKFTVLPQAIVRFNACASMTDTEINDKTLKYDCAIACSPFRYTKAGDLITVSAGLMHDRQSFVTDVDENYGMHFYTAYGEIDAKFITLRGGYNFGGEWLHKKDVTGDMKNGMFVSLSGKLFF